MARQRSPRDPPAGSQQRLSAQTAAGGSTTLPGGSHTCCHPYPGEKTGICSFIQWFIEGRADEVLDQEVWWMFSERSDPSIDGIICTRFIHLEHLPGAHRWTDSVLVPAPPCHMLWTLTPSSYHPYTVLLVSSGSLEEGRPAEAVQTQATVSLHELESCCQGNSLELWSARFEHLHEPKQNESKFEIKRFWIEPTSNNTNMNCCFCQQIQSYVQMWLARKHYRARLNFFRENVCFSPLLFSFHASSEKRMHQKDL